MKKQAFTIIELMVVIAIILVLASFLIPALKNAKNSASINSCMSNVKNLTQAIIVFSTDNTGFLEGLPYTSVSNNLEKIYGTIYQNDTWTSLKNLKCPLADTEPPTGNGYGQPLVMSTGTAINYHVVFSGNEVRSENGDLLLNTILSPGQNILIIEDFSEALWSTSTRHKSGGTCGRINGSAEFLTTFPKNKGNVDLSKIAKPSI